MGMVSIDKLEPGMFLAADVHDRNGRLLLKAETELSEKNIYVLRTWGILGVNINGMEEECVSPADGVVEPHRLACAEEKIRPLFRHANLEHPGMKELFNLCILRRAQNDNC